MLFESLTSDGNFKISVAQSLNGLYSASITRNAPRSYGANSSNLDLIWSKFELGATPVQALRNVFREHYRWMQWQHGFIDNPYKSDTVLAVDISKDHNWKMLIDVFLNKKANVTMLDDRYDACLMKSTMDEIKIACRKRGAYHDSFSFFDNHQSLREAMLNISPIWRVSW